MLERFTPTAAEAMRLAEREADAASAPLVAAEHLLLGLLQVRGVAAVVLQQSGADLGTLRAGLASAGRGLASPRALAQKLSHVLRKSLGSDGPRYAENLSRIIARADEAARELAHPKVGTEHLLWAVVEHSDGDTRAYFDSIDLSPEQARRRILEMLRVAQTALDDQATRHDDPTRKRRKATPMLEAFTHDLVRRARKNRLPKLLRRPEESDRLREALLRATSRNALIVGPPGAGRTSLVLALAKEIALGAAPEPLLPLRIRELDAVLLVAGTKYRGQFEERIVGLLSEIAERRDVVLFLDDLHLLAPPRSGSPGDGAASGVGELLDLLTPAIDRNEIQIIATVAAHAEARVMSRYGVLSSSFHRIAIAEPDRDVTRAILEKKTSALEGHHRLIIDRSAIDTALDLAAKSVSRRSLVVRALDVLDEACARIALDRDLRGIPARTVDAEALGAVPIEVDPPTAESGKVRHA